MRLLLGRDAVRAAAEAERTRAEADRKWRSLSESTDFIDDAGQTSNPASRSSSTGGRADLKSRTWLITGASSGLGYALAEFVLQRGDRVVLAARSMNSMSGLAARYPDRALAVGLDVTQPQQRIAAVERAQAHFGGIDVLVKNAGIDFLGAVEEQREEDYRAQFEVNFFGAVSMLRLVLPGMRRRQSGTIVNISSMDGSASLPVNGYYASSKFALEGITESLWQEIEPIGLRALLVEPGSFRTGIEQRTRFSGEPIEAYEATSGAFRKMMTTVSPDMFPGDPVRAAAAIYEVVASESPRRWVVLGSDAQRRIGAKLDMLRAEFEAGDLRVELRNRGVLLARPPHDFRLTARRKGRSDLDEHAVSIHDCRVALLDRDARSLLSRAGGARNLSRQSLRLYVDAGRCVIRRGPFSNHRTTHSRPPTLHCAAL